MSINIELKKNLIYLFHYCSTWQIKKNVTVISYKILNLSFLKNKKWEETQKKKKKK